MKRHFLLACEVAAVLAFGLGAGYGYNRMQADAGKPHVDLHRQAFHRPARSPASDVASPPIDSTPDKVPGASTATDGGPKEGATEPARVEGTAAAHPAHEFQTIDTAGVEAIVDRSDIGALTTLILDARDSDHYEAGHIPGAIRCYFSTLEQDFERIRERVIEAGYRVVVYCNGGECEDSLNLCRALILEHGVPKDNVLLYEDGWESWNQDGRPTSSGGADGDES